MNHSDVTNGTGSNNLDEDYGDDDDDDGDGLDPDNKTNFKTHSAYLEEKWLQCTLSVRLQQLVEKMLTKN